MKKRVALVVVVAWVLTLPALAQRPEEEHGSGAPRGGEMQRPAARRFSSLEGTRQPYGI